MVFILISKLNINAHNKVRKPDSLYMEAVKP